MMRRWLALAALLLLAACSKAPLYQEQAYVFGTIVDVSIYGEDEAKARQGVAAVLAEFQRLHDLLHAWQPSELSRLNAAIAQGKSYTVPTEVATMLQDAAAYAQRSGDTFNPAIGRLIALWGFHDDTFKAVLPDARNIAALLKAQPQMSDLRFDGNTVSSRNRAVQLDLGGYAKGYALDRAAAILRAQGVRNALINIGGNVMALGTHGTRPWRVGIQHPRRSGALATLVLHDGEAVGTSGDYQRYFELDGKRFCHLIDPRSGWPAQGVQAVTVLTRGTQAGLRSDVTSKPLFIAGVNGWRQAARDMQLEDALLIDDQGRVHLSGDMQKRLEFADDKTVVIVEP
ncbi:MAG: FAD:protein FMN transferase [Pseudomonadota bacterium]